MEWREIDCLALGEGEEVVLFLAAIHGNERAGTPLLRRLARHLRAHPDLLDGRTVLLVPEANPDGAARRRRYNARGVDLNRNFPSANRVSRPRYGGAPLTEPEALALAGLIDRRRPDRIVSLHEPLACVDYDGPGKALAGRLAEACGLPLRRLGGQPGSLGSYVGETLGIPIVTLELPPVARTLDADRLWKRYGAALLEAVVERDGGGFAD